MTSNALAMISPVLLRFGGLEVRWYGAMVAIGVLAAYFLNCRRAKLYDFKNDDVADIITWGMVLALFGARLLYVIRFWREQFAQSPLNIIKVWQGGLVFFGGFMGATVAVLLLCRVRKWAPWRAADLMAPSLPLGHAFGRIGCLINGCCYGFAYDGFGSVHYPQWGVTAFPVQLLFSVINLIICGILLWMEHRGIWKKRLFLAYLLLYSIGRFLGEFARGDYPSEQLWHGLTPAQVTCLWLAPCAIALYVAVHFLTLKKHAATPQN